MAGYFAEKYKERQVSEIEEYDFAIEINAIFKLVSSDNENGFDDLLKEIGEKFLKQKFKKKEKNEHKVKEENSVKEKGTQKKDCVCILI